MSAADRHRMAVASHLLLHDDEGRVLFARRAGTGWADGSWALPAGHVEAGESVVRTCVREAREELQIDLHPDDVQFALVQHKRDLDGQERVDVFFTANLPADATATIGEPDKCDALSWAHLEAAPRPMADFLVAALEVIERGHGPGLSCFGFADGPGR